MPDTSNFLNFEIDISGYNGREFQAAVNSPEGESRERIYFPYEKAVLTGNLKVLQSAIAGPGSPKAKKERDRIDQPFRNLLPQKTEAIDIQNFGLSLFKILFSGSVRDRYEASLARAFAKNQGLRVRLQIDDPEIAIIPWEFLYDPDRAEYMCLNLVTPLVRYAKIPRPILPLTVNGPVRILGMVASPKGYPELDVEAEKLKVEEALAHLLKEGVFELSWVKGQTWQHLQDELRAGPWHVFHFIGHGRFDQERKEGQLAFCNDAGEPLPLAASDLARLLANAGSVRLAILNNCESARNSGDGLFSSVAAALMRRNLPAVLAMQYPITDMAAILLAKTFYSALAKGFSIDGALTEARVALKIGMGESLEWGTPVLYLRAPDGILFSLSRSSLTIDPAISPQLPITAINQSANSRAKKNAVQHLFLDAAMPRTVTVGELTELLVMIRLPDSKGLRQYLITQEDYQAGPEDVKSTDFKLDFPQDENGLLEPLEVLVDIQTNDFNLVGHKRKKTKLYPGEDSDALVFLISPVRPGQLTLLIEVMLANETVLASGYFRISSAGKVFSTEPESAKVILSVPLGTIGIAEGQTTASTTSPQKETSSPNQLPFEAVDFNPPISNVATGNTQTDLAKPFPNYYSTPSELPDYSNAPNMISDYDPSVIKHIYQPLTQLPTNISNITPDSQPGTNNRNNVRKKVGPLFRVASTVSSAVVILLFTSVFLIFLTSQIGSPSRTVTPVNNFTPTASVNILPTPTVPVVTPKVTQTNLFTAPSLTSAVFQTSLAATTTKPLAILGSGFARRNDKNPPDPADVTTQFSEVDEIFGYVQFGDAIPNLTQIQIRLSTSDATQPPTSSTYTLPEKEGFFFFSLGQLKNGTYTINILYNGIVWSPSNSFSVRQNQVITTQSQSQSQQTIKPLTPTPRTNTGQTTKPATSKPVTPTPTPPLTCVPGQC